MSGTEHGSCHVHYFQEILRSAFSRETKTESFRLLTDNADPTIVHILVLNSLDREATASYSLVLYATDTGGDIGKLYNVCKIWWLSKISFLFFSEL